MRKVLLTVMFGVVTVGCAPSPSNFAIEKFFEVKDVCDSSAATDNVFSANGFLDVAPGNPQFFIGVLISGGLTIIQPPVVVGNVTLEPENRDRPQLRQQVATYRFGKSVPFAVKPYTTNFSTSFSEDGTITGPVQLISPELGQSLFDFLGPSDSLEDSIDLFVDLEFTGIMSGSGGAITTGKATYPIKVFRSTSAACPTPLANACRYLGQSSSQLLQPKYVCP